VLAALLVIRALRDKLDRSEHDLISLAREWKITWQRIADALEMRSRQAAERRHLLQLSRARPRLGAPAPRTQSERVERERDRRGRWAPNSSGLSDAPAPSAAWHHSLPRSLTSRTAWTVPESHV